MDYFRKFFLKILIRLLCLHRRLHLHLLQLLLLYLTLCTVLFVPAAHCQHGGGYPIPIEEEPRFLAPLENLTIPQGREVVFTCVADNLGTYRVAWIKSDSKAILALHTHMVAKNERLSVTHNGHNTWKLHIAHVQLNDSGSYMCQINTDPMRSQSGYLNVVVPPDIVNGPDGGDGMSDEGGIPENGTVRLACFATGVPKPSVQWKREDGRDIVLRSEGSAGSSSGRENKQVVRHVDGTNLTLHHVHRTDMGSYMCIASNRVPPAISKRFQVKVNFMPSIRAVSQLVGAPIHRQVVLECIVEAYPQPLMGWATVDRPKLYHSDKYHISEVMLNSYTWALNLTIRNLQVTDFREYLCTSDNGLGSAEARVRLREIQTETSSTTTAVPYIPSTQKPRRKQQPNNKNNIPDVVKPKDYYSQYPHQVVDIELNPLAETPTQTPSRNSQDKMRNTPLPAPMPTHKTSWIATSSAPRVLRTEFLVFIIPIILRFL